MKIWKTLGCLGLLVVIICGCVMLGQPTEVQAKEEESTQSPEEQTGTPQSPVDQEQEPPAEDTPAPPSTDNSVTVEKAYSEGLAFRSNGDGTCALSGLGTFTGACVLIPPKSPTGDTVTEILPRAFADSIVSAVEIPAGVHTLSAASFEGCARLSYIRIATGNTAFEEFDGALYTAEGRALVYCPAGRAAKELTLHTGLRRILAGAMADCPALSTVYFVGTSAEWQGIIVGDENEALYSAALHFKTS